MKLRKLAAFIGLGVLLAVLAGPAARPVLAAGDPYGLISAVNQLRAANGLYAYQTNDLLMSSAQGQSNYQASLGTWTHTGPGGSDETQRAYAAGYGGSARILCDENVAWGYNLSAQGTVEMWMDAVHLANMLSPRYIDAGAGATTDSENRVFYTLDVCYTEGSARPQDAQAGTGGSGSSNAAQATTEPIYVIQTATPGADGSIVHVVQPGQTLIGIAKAYGITLAELLALNNLTASSVIWPDEKLLIRVAPTPTPTSETTSTFTPGPATPTRRPTRTPTLTPVPVTIEPTSTVSATPTAIPSIFQADTTGSYLVGGVMIFAAAGVILIVFGAVLKRKS